MHLAPFLSELFGGAPFEEKADLTTLRQFSSPNAYCCNAAGEVTGICATEIGVEAVDFPAMPSLQYLNVGDNKGLKSWTFAAAVPALVHFDVSDSGLTRHLKLPMGFDNLVWLDAARNEISEFVAMGRLPTLEHLDLSGNQLREYSAHILRKLPALRRLYLNKNPLPSAKLEAAAERGDCLGLMHNFLLDIEKQGETENKEFKVILVGNGGVGKSCLVERLVYDTFEQRHLSTNGVVLEQYPREPTDFPYLLNLWDFAGQDIYHATHRLFMQANAVYLALWDEETRLDPISYITENGKREPYENFPLDYWLHYIRHQAGDSPIIVVKTKAKTDKAPYPTQLELQGKYDPLAFLYIDSAQEAPANGISDVLHYVKKSIETKLPIEKELPSSWAAVRQHLRDLQRNGLKALAYDEYIDIAATDKEVTDPQQVLTWLAHTGAVFYRKGYFGDALMLDQGWAIDAIYAIFRRDNSSFHRLRDGQKGTFSGADLQEIWRKSRLQNQPKAYNEAEEALLLQFMLGCELCFETTPEREGQQEAPFAERQFIAPQLLPGDVPTAVELLENKEDMLHICYRHDFLHQGVIQRFIVRAQTLADKRDIWLYGITLKENGQFAVVRSERATHRGSHAYDVNVLCDRNNLSLMDRIRNTLEELQGEAVEEWVSHNGENWVSMAELARLEGKWENIPDENGNPVPIAELQVFRERREREKLQRPQAEDRQQTEDLMARMGKEQMNLPAVDIPELTFAEGEHTVLFLQANPTDKPINWEGEFTDIIGVVEGSSMKCEKKKNASINDFNDAVEDYAPSVLHFCGHGEEGDYKTGTPAGLVFHNEGKTGKEVLNAVKLERLFKRTKSDFPGLQLVFLNACHSSEQAQAISRAGLFVLGTKREITTAAARQFAAGVYRNLANNQDLIRGIKRGISRACLADEDVNTLIEAYYDGARIFPK